jgi:UDP-glucuronate decarboxylase
MLSPAVVRDLGGCDTRIILTGAGGWMGLATIDLLRSALGASFAQRVVCFGSSARDLLLADGTTVPQFPLSAIGQLHPRPSWLLHFAFLTKDRAEELSEADYRAANTEISETVLGALDAIGVEAVFVASSGAATRADDLAANDAMRLYGAMKLADEALFANWATRTGKRAVIGRVFSITGPYINKHHAYAMASFILDALAGRAIIVRAPRSVIRSYVALRELISLIFALLGAAPSGVVRFDSGGDPLELGDVAQGVCDALNGAGVERAAITETPADSYHGDAAAYAALLAAHGIEAVSLRDQVIETAGFLRNMKEMGA